MCALQAAGFVLMRISSKSAIQFYWKPPENVMVNIVTLAVHQVEKMVSSKSRIPKGKMLTDGPSRFNELRSSIQGFLIRISV